MFVTVSSVLICYIHLAFLTTAGFLSSRTHLILSCHRVSSICVLSISVADPDHFDTDQNPRLMLGSGKMIWIRLDLELPHYSNVNPACHTRLVEKEASRGYPRSRAWLVFRHSVSEIVDVSSPRPIHPVNHRGGIK